MSSTSPAPALAPTAGESLSEGDCGQTNKRRRLQEDAGQPVQIDDRISALPDAILVHILSSLKIREAAMTSCISTRWRHLWKKSPVLNIDNHIFLPKAIPDSSTSDESKDPQFRDVREKKFIEKVNGLLQHHHGKGIKKFKVHFALDSTHAPDLDQWVDFVARSGIKELKFYLAEHSMRAIPPARPYDFPSQYFAGVRGFLLRKLSLWNCSLVTSPYYDVFLSLTSLNLKHVSIADADISNVLSCCGALKYLKLRRCQQLFNLSISHARLIYLDVCRLENLESIIIHADNLVSFEYNGQKIDIKYESAPKLKRVVTLFVKETGFPLDRLGALPKLRTLLLQFCSPLEKSSALQDTQRFAGLKHIMLLLLTSWNESIRSVADLLKATPSVEKLQLEAYSDPQLPKKLKITWPKHCSLKRLHTVDLGGFSGESELMELAFFLLRKAPALKMLRIDTHRRHYRGADKWNREKNEDAIRCYYARGIALTNLAPRVPSTVKFLIK